MSFFNRLTTRFLTTALPPETSHELAVWLLEHGLFPQLPRVDAPCLRIQAAGLSFPNPLGMAAGFDKDARAFPALLAMGFGHVEVGTLTPLAQAGNPRPRLFRMREDAAIINRMGFNNRGQAAARRRIARWRASGGRGLIGANIGANKTSLDRIADYAHGARCMAPVADWLTINVSSPNTPGLRNLQGPAELARILDVVVETMAASGHVRPVFVKIAPDITDDNLPGIVDTCIAHGASGLIISNTTVARPKDLKGRHAEETGGLSGRPLFVRSTQMLAKARLLCDGKLVLIGAGGIDNGEAAWQKILAGANLIQIYTGFIWQGPDIVPEILHYLAEKCRVEGLNSIDAATGRRAKDWAEGTAGNEVGS